MKKRLLYILYNSIILFFCPLVFSYYLFRLTLKKGYRRGLLERLGYINHLRTVVEDNNRPIWFHAVSVGEVNALTPLVKRLKTIHPDLHFIVSTITPTGREMAKKNMAFVDSVIYLPVDLPWAVKKAVRIVNPRAFCVIETEIWPNLIRRLALEQIPILMINGRMSLNSFKRYNLFRTFFKGILGYFRTFSMQTEEDACRILSLGAEKKKVVVTGNIKYHQHDLILSSKELEELYKELRLRPTWKVIVAGSTHRNEEEILLRVFKAVKKTFPSSRLIIAPRHPQRFGEVEDLIVDSGLKLARKRGDKGFGDEADVLLLDTIGDLRRVYAVGNVAFVGGSLVDTGGQNIIEPAYHKKPVLFGPYVDNFSSIAKALEKGGGGIKVNNEKDLLFQINRLLCNPQVSKEIGERAYRIVEMNKGALDKNIKIIEEVINDGYREHTD